MRGKMNRLLIIGAGGHGRVVKESADAMGGYARIDFVDDNSPDAIGKIADLEQLRSKYDDAFVGIGNNHVRNELITKLMDLGYEIPILIHPTAYVSPSSRILIGTIIEPKAIVNANARVGYGCIISVGAIVDHDVTIEECAHVNAGAICKAGAHIPAEERIDAGQIVSGY